MATKRQTEVPGFDEDSKIEQVPLGELKVDRAYQRDLSTRLVEQIRDNWDAVASELILVSRRKNGDIYIVNGQHRVAASRMLGHEMIWSRVVEGLTARQEAALRLKTNVRISDRPLERFKASVASGSEESLAIVKILEEFGTEINEVPSVEIGINAVTTVESVYRVDNEGRLLREVLAIIRDSFGVVGGKLVSSYMLKAIAWFVDRHSEEADRNHLVQRIKDFGISAIDRRARTMQGTMGGSLWANYYRAIIDVYNERLREKSRLEWRLRGAGRFASEGTSWARGGGRS